MPDTEVKLLEKEFVGRGEVKGRKFKRIKSTKYAYLYEVDSKYYEVIKRAINKLYNTETYPSSKMFGINGFTYSNYHEANDRFLKITKAGIKKQSKHD